MEIIVDIREANDILIDGLYGSHDGYIVTTDEQTITVAVSNDQSCCESWGYLCSEDDPREFIGSALLGIEVVNQALNTQTMVDTYDGGAIFVNFRTGRGIFQLVVYNSHNGYYGHHAAVRSRQVNLDETI